MKKQICLIVLFLSCKICYSQNFVSNGGFEQFTSCPGNFSEITLAFPWTVPTVLNSTDYFNECATNVQVGVPVNINGVGFQVAHGGAAYSGIYVYHINNSREYLEVPVDPPLVMNQSYHFEMFVNLYNISAHTTSCIGVYFSDTLISGMATNFALPFIPQITNTPGNVFDTLGWVQVSGNYQAHGGESFLVIGNFNDNFNTDTTLINSSGNASSYVYVDDVSLTPQGGTGIDEADKNNVHVKIWPNPVFDKMNITIDNAAPSEIILYDISSRKVLQQEFTSSAILNTEQLARGIYIYEVRNKNGVVTMGKVVKE